MLRHSREMTRHHRERIIKKRYNQWWMNPIFKRAEQDGFDPARYGRPWLHTGYLNKLSMHHHRCDYCVQKYERAKDKTRFNREQYHEF